jgi:quercetin dioxygenase-like cupin family protein
MRGMRRLWYLAVMVLLGAVSTVRADEATHGTMHNMWTPAEVKWGEGPASLPPGAKMAALYGDPGKPGLFVVQMKFPANYKIPAHWHPTDENVTVISGTFMMGMADKLDPAKTTSLPPGSFASMPAKTNHFAMTKKETIVEIAAIGPFAITYVNPADDPRKTAAAAPPK